MKKWAGKLWLPLSLVAVGVAATLLVPRLRNFANLNRDDIEHLKNLGELVAIPVGALWAVLIIVLESRRDRSKEGGHDVIQAGGDVQTGGVDAQGNISAGSDMVAGNKEVTDQSKHVQGDLIEQQTIIKQQIIQQAAPPPVLNALHSLPPPPADFTGREAELAELRAAIEQGGAHISGLQGQGGVGKTALALKLAEELTPKYPDAQIYLDLKGVSERPLVPAEAMAYVVHVFHAEAKLPDSESELGALYLSTLHHKRALLLMDNARDAAQVAPLIPPVSCALLVTSRLQFTLPGLRDKRLNALPEEKAKELLIEICPRIDGQAGAIATLCGRLPLALRLAATALKEKVNLTPGEYVQRLQQRKLEAVRQRALTPAWKLPSS